MKSIVGSTVSLALIFAFAVCVVASEQKLSTPDFRFALTFTCTPVNGTNFAVASSSSLTTQVYWNEPHFSETIFPTEGQALWTSVTINQTATSWSEQGNLTFGGGHYLFFESPGMTGTIYSSFYGAISYNITGGTGRFAGASGMMVDTFVAPNASSPSFEINAWGFVWLP